MYELTVFGDSVMEGVLLEDGRYTVNKGERQALEERFGIAADNCSKFGATIEKGLSFAERRLRRGELKPCTLIEFGGNDSDFLWTEIAAQPEGEHQCKTPPQRFITAYRELIRLIKSAGSCPLIATLPPVSAEKYFKWFCRDGLDGDSIMRWLGDVNSIYRWQERYSRMAEHIAAQEGCAIVDLRDAFQYKAQALNELLCDDGIHPNRAGQELIYKTISGVMSTIHAD